VRDKPIIGEKRPTCARCAIWRLALLVTIALLAASAAAPW
jgi:hypothetical protein